MATVQLDLDDALVSLLEQLNLPVPAAVRELVVMELYRRELITGGRAAELLGVPWSDFLEHTSELGIPYFRMTIDEVLEDQAQIHALSR